MLPDDECGGGNDDGGRESDSGENRPPRPDFFSFFTSPAEEVFSEERLFESGSFLTGLYGDAGSLKMEECRHLTQKMQFNTQKYNDNNE